MRAKDWKEVNKLFLTTFEFPKNWTRSADVKVKEFCLSQVDN